MNTSVTQGCARTGRSDILKPGAHLRLAILFLLFTLGLALAAPALAAPPAVLSTGHLAQIAPGDFIFRVVDLTLAPGDAVVTHKHGAGMTYAISGSHVLTLDGIATRLNPGQAGWIGDQAVHSHASDGTTATRFLFMYLWPASQKGAPMAPGFREAKVAFESDNLTFANRQAQDVVLADNTLATGQQAGVQSYAGPTLLSIQSGTFSVKVGDSSRTMQTGEYVSVPAGTAVQYTASAAGNLLALSIVPAGQPVSLPQASSPLESIAPFASLALLALALLGVGWTIYRRRAQPRRQP